MVKAKVVQPSKVTVRCAQTGKEVLVDSCADGTPKLPIGWKEAGGKRYCKAAFYSLYVPRSVCLPVASVVLGREGDSWTQQECRKGREAFNEALRLSWLQATQVSNWLFRRLAILDNDPLVDNKLPKFSPPTKCLYAEARQLFPELDSQSYGQIQKQILGKYNSSRFATRFTFSKSVETFLYPTPFPIPKKDSPLTMSDQRQPFLRLRISGQNFTVRLRNGTDYSRQICNLGAVCDGLLPRGTCSIFDGKRGDTMVSLCVWLPRKVNDRGCTRPFRGSICCSLTTCLHF